jgi:hypothetical protein
VIPRPAPVASPERRLLREPVISPARSRTSETTWHSGESARQMSRGPAFLGPKECEHRPCGLLSVRVGRRCPGRAAGSSRPAGPWILPRRAGAEAPCSLQTVGLATATATAALSGGSVQDRLDGIRRRGLLRRRRRGAGDARVPRRHPRLRDGRRRALSHSQTPAFTTITAPAIHGQSGRLREGAGVRWTVCSEGTATGCRSRAAFFNASRM